MHTITIHNPVMASCNLQLAKLIKPCMSWPVVYYRQGFRGKERKTYDKTILTRGANGVHYFWAGLTQTVVDYCKANNIEIEVKDKSKEEVTIYEPELPGITFRNDQIKLIDAFLDNLRGILVAFTGSGKTVLGFGCLSAFEHIKILWLCHKKDLMIQAYDEAKQFGFKSVGRFGDGYKEINKDLVIATRQSFRQIADEYGHEFDAVVVDEVHHVAEIEGEYAYVLSRVLAPIRLGLTATLPREGEPYITSVGLIGPVLEELTINAGAELGILAKPTIKILRIKKNYEISKLRNYSAIYNAAIVHCLERNKLIADTVKKHVALGDTILIMINQIEHGENIQKELDKLGIENYFVRGATSGDERNKIKHKLDKGRIHCVICSSVWTEGVNIPNLNVVICAAGGKSEIRTLQSIGRGLRKTEGKSECTIYDFFDQSHAYLIDHFGERLLVYLENQWL